MRARGWLAAVGLACTFDRTADHDPEEFVDLKVCEQPDQEACSIAADGVARAPITIEFPGGSIADKDLTLTTTLGTLGPAAGSPQATLALKTPETGPLSAYLYAGLDSGTAVIRATIGTIVVEEEVVLTTAEPTALDILGNVYELAAGGSIASDLSIYLYNESPDRASVSSGVDVHLQACSAEGKIADVPRLVRTAAPNTGLVTAKVTLNALGAGILNMTGSEKTQLQVYAYVEGTTEIELREDATCDEVAVQMEHAVVYDSLVINLLRKPM